MRTNLVRGWVLSWLCILCICLQTHAQAIDWQEYTKARLAALEGGFPLLVLLHDPECANCRKLAETTLADPAVVAAIRKGFLTTWVCKKQHGAMAAMLTSVYGFQQYPVVIFAAPNGTVMHSATGFVDTTAMLEHITTALSRIRNNEVKAAPTPAKPTTTASQATGPQPYRYPYNPTAWLAPAQQSGYQQTSQYFTPYPAFYATPSYWPDSGNILGFGYPSYPTSPRRC